MNMQIRHKTEKESRKSRKSRKWLAAPSIGYWPQQLNFALWGATTGSGILGDILVTSGMGLSLQLRLFYNFHIYVELLLDELDFRFDVIGIDLGNKNYKL